LRERGNRGLSLIFCRIKFLCTDGSRACFFLCTCNAVSSCLVGVVDRRTKRRGAMGAEKRPKIRSVWKYLVALFGLMCANCLIGGGPWGVLGLS